MDVHATQTLNIDISVMPSWKDLDACRGRKKGQFGVYTETLLTDAKRAEWAQWPQSVVDMYTVVQLKVS